MIDFDFGFCVGLFEGEGCITTKSGGGQNPIRLIINMTDREPLDRVATVLGGKVFGPYPVKNMRKPIYNWIVSDWLNVIRIATAMRPYLCPRRQAQIDTALALAPKHPRGGLACPETPFPSVKGARRHKVLGELPCVICKESELLYYRVRNARNKKVHVGP